MTKKVISIIFLIVTSLIFATSVFADFVGLDGKSFDIIFKLEQDNFVEINVRNMDNNADVDELDATIYDNEDTALQNSQCQIVVATNFEPGIKITFNLFKYYDEDEKTYDENKTFGYIVRLKGDDGNIIENNGTNYARLEVNRDGVEATFVAGNQNNYDEYKYPISFKLNLEDADSGTYLAEITVEVTTT